MYRIYTDHWAENRSGQVQRPGPLCVSGLAHAFPEALQPLESEATGRCWCADFRGDAGGNHGNLGSNPLVSSMAGESVFYGHELFLHWKTGKFIDFPASHGGFKSLTGSKWAWTLRFGGWPWNHDQRRCSPTKPLCHCWWLQRGWCPSIFGFYIAGESVL